MIIIAMTDGTAKVFSSQINAFKADLHRFERIAVALEGHCGK